MTPQAEFVQPAAQHANGRSLLVMYAYLQALDLMTTLVFLVSGVQEANPFIRFLMSAAPMPILGLAAGKTLGLILGIYCWKFDRLTLLSRANVFFGLLVMWNLFCLLVQLGSR